jgi:hypothetical protein
MSGKVGMGIRATLARKDTVNGLCMVMGIKDTPDGTTDWRARLAACSTHHYRRQASCHLAPVNNTPDALRPSSTDPARRLLGRTHGIRPGDKSNADVLAATLGLVNARGGRR